MTRSAYKLSKKLLGEEPGKQAVLFALFALCSADEISALEWIFPSELAEWQKRDRNQIPEDEDILKTLGFNKKGYL